VVVAELFERGGFEAVGFVHYQEFGVACGVEHAVFVDTAALGEHELDVPAEPVAQVGDLFVEVVGGVVDLGGEHDGAGGEDLFGGGVRVVGADRVGAVQLVGEFVPLGVVAG
jgi:hypothetical protein